MIKRGLAAMTSVAGVVGLSGCDNSVRTARIPGTPWPRLNASPKSYGTIAVNDRKPNISVSSGAGSPGNPISRSVWTSSRPISSRINPMPMPLRRITIHHDGLPSSITMDSKRRLSTIRNGHVSGRGWADIGYHFIIDRNGKVWEGRALHYQGAHVRNNNEHNIGVLCMGNFEIHQPTSAQLNSLAGQVKWLRRKYGISTSNVLTHREINPTQCPGRNLQPRVVAMRKARAFV